MSDLFTKAANVKTTTKLWIVGAALLIMVSIPYADDHYQPTKVTAPLPHLNSVTPGNTLASPNVRPSDTANITAHPRTQRIASSPLAGDYIGTVHNATAAVSADFAIKVHDSGGDLTGFMTVKPPLYGSGALNGKMDGNSVAFSVSSTTGTIVFDGAAKGNHVIGTYTVKKAGGGQETGTFTLAKQIAAPVVSQTPETPPTIALTQPASTSSPAPPAPVAEAPKAILAPIQHSNPKNYSSCMSGFAYACNKALLTSDEAANVAANDLRRNYSSCMSGFAYACTKAQLTPEEAATVAASDLRRNYSSCLSSFAYACNKNLLTPDQLGTVQASDLRRNYSNCLSGLSYACNRSLLTSDQLLEVQAKDQTRRK